jgi:hypothetical protein
MDGAVCRHLRLTRSVRPRFFRHAIVRAACKFPEADAPEDTSRVPVGRCLALRFAGPDTIRVGSARAREAPSNAFPGDPYTGTPRPFANGCRPLQSGEFNRWDF